MLTIFFIVAVELCFETVLPENAMLKKLTVAFAAPNFGSLEANGLNTALITSYIFVLMNYP